ncbi:MAG: TRAP transporter substrate-binding protein DctP [Anaerovoracaceae bacterium]
MPYSDLYSAMQNGLCEGWLGGSGLTNYDSFRDVIKYFVDCNVVNECIPIFMNQELFDSLPEDYQTIVSEAFKTAQNTVNSERSEQEVQALVDMEEYGITVIEPTDEELAQLRDRIRQEVWPKMAEEIGEDLLQQTCEHYGVTLG